jgi:hypothetical protein
LSLGELILKIKPFLIISTSFDKMQGEGEKKISHVFEKNSDVFQKISHVFWKKSNVF